MKKAIVLTALCLLITNGIAKDLGWLLKEPYQLQRNQTQVMYSQTYNPTGKERHCSPVGAYATEFGLATAGSLYAVIVGMTVAGLLWEQGGEVGYMLAPYVMDGIYGITCPFLTAGGACLGGKICGQKGSYWRTVLGSFLGEAAGFGAGIWYLNFATKDGSLTYAEDLVYALCLGIPPALGATITYNLWM